MTEPAHFRFPHITWAAIRTELARELASRRAAYRDWVAKARMTQEEADWQLAVIEAIGMDAARFEACRSKFPVTNPLTRPSGHRFTWAERRAALLRELDYRARLYPDWIRKARLTQADADRQCACLEAMLALYEEGLDWTPANTVMPAFASLTPTHEQQASRDEWTEIERAISARKNPARQEAMAL